MAAIAAHVATAGLGVLGTAVSSIGGYYISSGTYPEITGAIDIPTITASWGGVLIASAGMCEGALRIPVRRTVLGAVLLLLTVMGGISVTTAIAAAEQHNMPLRVAANTRRIIQNTGNMGYLNIFKNILTDIAINPFRTRRVTLAAAEQEFSCCGGIGYTDYHDTARFRHGAVPTSCCRNEEPGCGQPGLSDPGLPIVIPNSRLLPDPNYRPIPNGRMSPGWFKSGCNDPITKARAEALWVCTATLGASAVLMIFVIIVISVYVAYGI